MLAYWVKIGFRRVGASRIAYLIVLEFAFSLSLILESYQPVSKHSILG